MRRPNVIVFFTDQQRWDSMGINGNPLNLTHNFDLLAKAGTHVPLAFTPQPVCGPARAVLQTGRFATSTGVWRNGVALDPNERTLAHEFNDAGYVTGYIGKWHLGSGRLAVPEAERGGYRKWLGANALEASSQPYRTVVYDEENREICLPGYRVDALTDAAIRFLNMHHAEPFFLFLSHLEPHFQNSHDSYPPPLVERGRRYGCLPPDLASLGGNSWQNYDGYMGMIKRLDEAFGRLLDALVSLDLLDDTIVLFTSDHGCHFKTRNSEYKRSCHESSIRIPMALHGRQFTGGGQLRELVSLVDIAPTLLDACGITVPEGMQGRSLLPYIERRAEPGSLRSELFVQISESHVGRAIRTQRWKYAIAAPNRDGVRDRDAKHYVETELYDLEHDPWELTNLSGLESHQMLSRRLAERLKAAMQAAGEEVPEIETAKPRKSGQRMVFTGEEEL